MFREFILRIRAPVTSDMERGGETHRRDRKREDRGVLQRDMEGKTHDRDEEGPFKYKFRTRAFFIVA